MHNPCLNDPILEQLIELMFEMEQDMEEIQQQSGEPTTFSSTSSTSSSLLDSLDSFLLRDLFDQNKFKTNTTMSLTNPQDLTARILNPRSKKK